MKTEVFTQPKLPYAPDALAPAISQETVDYHYGRHEKAYIENLNKLIEGTEYADMDIEDIIRESERPHLQQCLTGMEPYLLFLHLLSRRVTTEPEGELRKAIDRDFGSFDNFKKEFVDAGVKLFGSGWVWLSRDQDGKLFITQKSNAGSPLTDGLTPILTFDVWEHAYYLDYQNRRAEALNKLWDIVDWEIVGNRYQ